MTTFEHERGIDRWLIEHRDMMVAALDEVIDVEAGLQEILIPAEHSRLVSGLDDVVDVEAGLAAIMPTPPAILASATRATRNSDLDRALWSISPVQRLALREAFEPLVGGSVLAAAGLVEHTSQRVQNIAQAMLWGDENAAGMCQMLRNALTRTECAVHRLRELVYHCDGTIYDEHSIYSRVEWSIHSGLGDLSDTISDLYDLVDTIESAERTRTQVLDPAPDPVARFAMLDCHVRSQEFVRESSDAASRLRALQHFLNDFIGADLREADLEGMHLVGVQWSLTTLWPSPEWRERIKKSSVEISDGIFEIGGDESRQPAAVH